MSGRPWRLSAKLLIASSIATVIGFSAVCTSVMLDMRRGELELAKQSLENLASGIDADISRPMLHRGAYAIVLSRRITGPDGGFLGVVAGSIRFSYFHELFSHLTLGPGDAIFAAQCHGAIGGVDDPAGVLAPPWSDRAD